MEVGKEYEGHIVNGNNSNDQRGLYLVFIPELDHNTNGKITPFWAQNCIAGNNFSRWKDFETGEILSSGSYKPLQPGMRVAIKFRTSSLNSCYIDRVKTDSPMLLPTSIRDQQYIINKTVKNSYIIQDDSVGETHIVNANGKTSIIMDNNRILLKVTEGAKENASTIHNSGFEIEESGMTYTIGNVGFSFNLDPVNKAGVRRGDLRIHPDGGATIGNGSAGCLALNGSQSELLKCENLLRDIIKQQKNIPVFVNIAGNTNNKTRRAGNE